MKILSTIIFIVLIGLVCLTPTTLSQKCLEHLGPLHLHETRMVDCPIVSSIDKRQQPTSDNLFFVDFHCLITDNILCGKINNVFITAGKFITATLI